MKILRIRGLTKQFGGLLAIRDIDFEVEKGEIFGIIGPNGAGKTTLFNTITGYHRPSLGSVLFEDRNVTGMKPNRIASLGLIRTFQQVNLVPGQTAFESIYAACHLRRRTGVISAVFHSAASSSEDRFFRNWTTDLMESMGLGEVKEGEAGSLPHGLQRLLGLCVALAAKPRLLLLDEPTAGMSASETAEIIGHIRRIREEGVTVALVEHDMKVIMNTCDRILVLNFGKTIAEGTPQEVSTNEEVIRAYLGFGKESRHYAA